MNTILAIHRAPCFSPNSVEKDRAIMAAVAERLRRHDLRVIETSEADGLDAEGESPVCILSMGRLPETLQWLARQGCRIVNRPEAVARCARSVVERLARQNGVPVAPADGPDGYWLKRGDACAQEPGDVVYCANRVELEAQQAVFRQRGITDYVVSAHVAGDLLKFYGVRGTPFFRWFYPTDDGISKFGDEQRNGPAHHYAFSAERLQADADRLADAIGMDVYGGDCIVRPDGTYCVIDFNDWPSFSRCREEAAEAIAGLVIRSI